MTEIIRREHESHPRHPLLSYNHHHHHHHHHQRQQQGQRMAFSSQPEPSGRPVYDRLFRSRPDARRIKKRCSLPVPAFAAPAPEVAATASARDPGPGPAPVPVPISDSAHQQASSQAIAARRHDEEREQLATRHTIQVQAISPGSSSL